MGDLPLNVDVAGANVLLEELREVEVGDALGEVCHEDGALSVLCSDVDCVLVVLARGGGHCLGDFEKLAEILHCE